MTPALNHHYEIAVGWDNVRLMSSPTPVVPARLDWPSTVGNFILNFGTLDLHVRDFLEAKLPPEDFAKLRFGEEVTAGKACRHG